MAGGGNTAAGRVGFLALAVMTLYILIQGYRVMTGQLRESMMGLVANMAKAAFIVAFAVAFGTVGSQVHTYLITDMKDGIHQLVTGSNSTPEEKITTIALGLRLLSGSAIGQESRTTSTPGITASRCTTWTGQQSRCSNRRSRRATEEKTWGASWQSG